MCIIRHGRKLIKLLQYKKERESMAKKCLRCATVRYDAQQCNTDRLLCGAYYSWSHRFQIPVLQGSLNKIHSPCLRKITAGSGHQNKNKLRFLISPLQFERGQVYVFIHSNTIIPLFFSHHCTDLFIKWSKLTLLCLLFKVFTQRRILSKTN